MNTHTITVTEAVTRILAATATHLDQHATTTHPITGVAEARCMTYGWLDTAVRAELGPVFEMVRGCRRHATQIEVEAAVRAALPPVTGTVAEYARGLRALTA
ncbi:hypothetical protein [Streptomyces sp. NPDC017086]|uniref:hypothetical protein n=1 Tax=Streptomyces sp. NPDC017086 TaxID=3364976 RepID=UPI0037A74D04